MLLTRELKKSRPRVTHRLALTIFTGFLWVISLPIAIYVSCMRIIRKFRKQLPLVLP
jgi:hypothetical protein